MQFEKFFERVKPADGVPTLGSDAAPTNAAYLTNDNVYACDRFGPGGEAKNSFVLEYDYVGAGVPVPLYASVFVYDTGRARWFLVGAKWLEPLAITAIPLFNVIDRSKATRGLEVVHMALVISDRAEAPDGDYTFGIASATNDVAEIGCCDGSEDVAGAVYVGEASFKFDDAWVIAQGYAPVVWQWPNPLDPANPLEVDHLPECDQVSIYAEVSVVGEVDDWDQCVELVMTPSTVIDPALLVEARNYVLAAWLWGPNFDLAKQFNEHEDDAEFVATASGPRAPWYVQAKAGVTALSSEDVVVTVRFTAYLHDGPNTSRDRINPQCTVPPCDLDGAYLFQRGDDVPAVQTAQCARAWSSRVVTRSIWSDLPIDVHVFGGPWSGQMSALGSDEGHLPIVQSISRDILLAYDRVVERNQAMSAAAHIGAPDELNAARFVTSTDAAEQSAFTANARITLCHEAAGAGGQLGSSITQRDVTTPSLPDLERGPARVNEAGVQFIGAATRDRRVQVFPVTTDVVLAHPCDCVRVNTDDVYVYGQPTERPWILVDGTTFADPTKWTGGGANWVVAGNRLTHTPGAVTAISGTILAANPTINTETYVVLLRIVSWTAGTVLATLNGTAGAAYGAIGTQVQALTASGAASFTLTPTNDFDGAIDLIKVFPPSPTYAKRTWEPDSYKQVVGVALIATPTVLATNIRTMLGWYRVPGAPEVS